MPRAEFVDAAPILWALRATKTPTEIARLRHLAEVTDAALSDAYSQLDAACTELDFERGLASGLVARGVAYCPVQSGGGPAQQRARSADSGVA